MSSNTPPDPYFSGINFNPSFFNVIQTYLTEAIANSKYLKLIGGTLTGFLGINRTARAELDVNGKAVINNNNISAPSIGILGSIGTKLILFDGTASEPPYALGVDAATLWYGTHSTGNHRFYTGTSERMFINSNGNVGIGTTSQTSVNTKLTIRGASTSYSQPLVDIIQTNPWDGNYALQVTGYTNLGGFRINASDGGNSIYQTLANKDIGIAQYPDAGNTGSISLNTFGTGAIKFFTNGNNERIRIDQNGRLGIANTSPSNILQVGSGQRLKISNGTTDFTIIGTIDTASTNNTKITLSGYQRSVQTGNIEYEAFNEHIFYSTNTGSYVEKARILVDDFAINTSCSTYGANFYTDGEYLNYQSKTNTSGTVKSGYFHTTAFLYNSLINLACSHTSPNYAYWHGHIGTNNSAEIIYFSTTQTANMTTESFKEQGTNITYILMYPNYAYNTGIQMRVKFYG